MTMAKDYLHNKFKHSIEAGILQYGVAQETTSADTTLSMFKKGIEG